MAARKKASGGTGRGRKGGRSRGADGAPAAPAAEDTTTTQPTRDLSNVAARRDYIAQACEEMYQLDSEIEAAIARHIKDLRDGKGEIMKVLREQYNIPAKLFRARYYPYRLERKAADNEDGPSQDTIAELFDALPVGEKITIVDPDNDADDQAGRAEAEETERTEEHDYENARELGKKAGLEGESLTACPYRGPTLGRMREHWESGWQTGQALRRGEEGSGGAAVH